MSFVIITMLKRMEMSTHIMYDQFFNYSFYYFIVVSLQLITCTKLVKIDRNIYIFFCNLYLV